MKRHRFFCEYQVNGNDVNIDDAAVVHQATRVLRFTNGEEIALCRGDGRETRVEITFFDRGIIKGVVKEVVELPPDAVREVILCAAITKKDLFEMVVQKATELGVARIIPIVSARTVKKDVRMSRLTDISREAAELSGRGTLPMIDEPMSLEEALQEVGDCEKWFGAISTWIPGQARDDVKKEGSRSNSTALFIGPEGGFTDEELKKLESVNAHPFSLTHLVLRAETAAIAAVNLFVRN